MPPQENPLVEENTNEENYYEDQAGPGPLTNVGAPDPESGTGAMAGITAFEAGWAIAEGIDSGDWKVALSGAVALGLDMAAAAIDPIGYLAGQIISWMLEHIEPARRMLDELAGNPGVVKAYAESWRNVEDEMTAVGEELKQSLPNETSGWKGLAVDAYRTKADELSGLYGGAAGLAHGLAALVEGMAEVVNGVRTAVRDILSAIAGSLISWTLEILGTLGAAAPAVVAQATAAISRVVSKCATLSTKLANVLGAAITLLVAIRDIWDGFIRQANALEAAG